MQQHSWRRFSSHGLSRIIVYSVFAILATTAVCQAEETPADKVTSPISEPIRKHIYHVGLSYHRFYLHGDNEVNFNRGNASFSVGTGLLDRRWYALASFNIFLGPYETVRADAVNLDYAGSGFALETAYTVQSGGLRRRSGSFGVFLGLDYMDIIGRSVGSSRRPLDDIDKLETQQETIRNYVNQIYHLSLTTGFVLAKLKPSRPMGNAPELLTTRIEGSVLKIGLSVPLFSHFRARYDRITSEGSQERVSLKGPFRGYAISLSLLVPLGI